MSTPVTPSQTVGPFFHIGLATIAHDDLTSSGIAGEPITIRGQVLDGDGQAVEDALLEIWQADSNGQYPERVDQAASSGEKRENYAQQTEALAADARQPANENAQTFRGFGRVPTGHSGSFHLVTVKPGRVAGPDGHLQAPHIVVTLFARGLLKQLTTRLYFPDEPSNARRRGAQAHTC